MRLKGLGHDADLHVRRIGLEDPLWDAFEHLLGSDQVVRARRIAGFEAPQRVS